MSPLKGKEVANEMALFFSIHFKSNGNFFIDLKLASILNLPQDVPLSFLLRTSRLHRLFRVPFYSDTRFRHYDRTCYLTRQFAPSNLSFLPSSSRNPSLSSRLKMFCIKFTVCFWYRSFSYFSKCSDKCNCKVCRSSRGNPSVVLNNFE